MKKLITTIQGIIIITAIISIIFIFAMLDSYQYDYITREQFLFGEAASALYIAFVWAVYMTLENIKRRKLY